MVQEHGIGWIRLNFLSGEMINEYDFQKENQVFLRLRNVDVTAKQLYHTVVDGKPVFRTRHSANGDVVTIENVHREPGRMTRTVRLDFKCGVDELLTGLGQHEYGIYDYHGKKEYIYQSNMITSMPFLLSDAGYGVLIEAECAMRFESEKGEFSFILEAVDDFSIVVFYGDSCAEVVKRFADMTGHTPLLPRWAYGYVQSKERYHSAEELVDVTEQFRREGIGLDCIVQDWHTWKKGLWGDKTPDEERYPSISELTDKLHELHTRLLVSVWPNMSPGGGDFEEFQKSGLLLPNSNVYNAYDENARKLYSEQCERYWGKGQVDGWWCDNSEPFSDADWTGTERAPEDIRYQRVTETAACSIDETRINSYPLYHAMGMYESWRKKHPEKRMVNLTRAGYTGSQKYGTVLWSGDISARWDVMRAQVIEGQKMAMSGISNWTLDIGAFFVHDYRRMNPDGTFLKTWFWNGCYNEGVNDPAYRELYVRWFQYGCFLPMFRSHGCDTPREPWQFGKPGDEEYDAICKMIGLRYRLLPYIYTAASQTWFEGLPMIRSMLLAAESDEAAKYQTGTYMLGDSLLVHPITEPGQTQTKLYLPNTSAWYDLESGQCYAGGQEVIIDTPLDKLPVFVKAGAVIPMAFGGVCTDEMSLLADEIHIYAGADDVSWLYGDQGDGYEYQDGKYMRVCMEWKDRERMLCVKYIHSGIGLHKTMDVILHTPDGKCLKKEASLCGEDLKIVF